LTEKGQKRGEETNLGNVERGDRKKQRKKKRKRKDTKRSSMVGRAGTSGEDDLLISSDLPVLYIESETQQARTYLTTRAPLPPLSIPASFLPGSHHPDFTVNPKTKPILRYDRKTNEQTRNSQQQPIPTDEDRIFIDRRGRSGEQ